MGIPISYHKTIYKTDSTGKLRFLQVYSTNADLVQVSGVVGSENPVTHTSTCKAKNIGKANETSPEQQARIEAEAKVIAKLTEGYFEDMDEARKTRVVSPMLAKSYMENAHKIDWSKPVFAQPKLDGMRSLIAKDQGCKSRAGKKIDTMNHITSEIDNLTVIDVLDGELYAHGRNFQENMRLIKKYRGPETEEVKYHVYDMVLLNIPFRERYALLSALVAGLKNVELVPTYPIRNEEDLKRIHKKFISLGYEGTMIRHGEEGYLIDVRADQLLKYKDFLDITAVIKDVVPMDKESDQGTFVFEWPGAKGHPLGVNILGCGMKFSHAERKEILLNRDKYIGQTGELRFFEYSEDGVPRFPICHGIRLDK